MPYIKLQNTSNINIVIIDMYTFIDAHTHLYSDEFEKDREAVIQHAKEVGVSACLLCAEKSEQFEEIIKLSERYRDFLFPCLGLHPVQGDPVTKGPRSVNLEDFEKAAPVIEKYADRIVAIGEVGLDFTPYWCKGDADKEAQRAVLTKQIELAKKFDLPLNVHSRSAGRPTIALLKQEGATRVLLHAFDGQASVALEGARLGYYFSVPPSAARPGNAQKNSLVERVPLESLVLETDSPALGPVKDERNVPANVRISCEHIAKVKNIDVETVARVTWENTLKLFPLLKQLIAK